MRNSCFRSSMVTDVDLAGCSALVHLMALVERSKQAHFGQQVQVKSRKLPLHPKSG